MVTRMVTPRYIKKITYCFLLLSMVLLAACSDSGNIGASAASAVVKTEKGQYTNISVSELQAMLKNKDFTFINVHVPYKGHIALTDAFIPYDQIDKNLDKLPADKRAKIVLYCHGGNMSQTAARTLANLGYRNVYQLVGGFADWQAAGLPLDTQKPY